MPESDHDLLVRIDERTENMHLQLLGPDGRVPKLEKAQEDIEDVQKKHAEQINFWRGGLALCGFVVLAFGAAFLIHIWGGH
jgi:hypothetical protein